jgi:hypothetical protein
MVFDRFAVNKFSKFMSELAMQTTSYAYAGDPSNDILAGRFLHVSKGCSYSSAVSQIFLTNTPPYN